MKDLRPEGFGRRSHHQYAESGAFLPVFWQRKAVLSSLFLIAFLLAMQNCGASTINVTAVVENAAPVVLDGNISPATWSGGSDLMLGFKCEDPNGIEDFNRADASITGANTADLNNISYVVSGIYAIISLDINSYITTMGAYYVTPFCIDDSNNVGVGTTLTGEYVLSIEINVQSPAQDANINASPPVEFDVNKNASVDVNQRSIAIDLNGTPSSDFNSMAHCTGFGGEFHCAYTETGLAVDADNNVVFRSADDSNNWALAVERIVHYDATAPIITSASASGSGSDVIFSWSGRDSFTGIQYYYIKADSGSWVNAGLGTSYTFSGHASSDHIYYVKAKDFADNNSLISSATYIAPTPPGPAPGPGGGGGGGGIPPVVPPAERKFDIKVVRFDDPVEVGGKFDFTYLVSNKTIAGGSAYIEYWLGTEGEKIVSGSETVYLSAGEEKEISSSLFLLKNMEGNYEFFLKLSMEGQDSVVRTRPVTVVLGAPTVIDLNVSGLNVSGLKPGDETGPVYFSIEVGSNRDEILPVLIEERVYRDGKLVWSKKQTVPIKVFKRFFEEIYGLEPGSYKLEVVASYEENKKQVLEFFEKKAEPVPSEAADLDSMLIGVLPWLLITALTTAMIALLYAGKRRILDFRKIFRRKRRKGF